jgi:hypothetical protein
MTLKPKDPIYGLPVGRVYGGSSTAKSTNGSCQYARDGLKLPLFGTHDTSLP